MTLVDFALDATTGDLSFDGQNLFNLIEGRPAVAQDLKCAFGLWEGEYFLDQEAGFGWLQDVLGQKPVNLPLLQVLFRSYILEREFITGIKDDPAFSIVFDPAVRGLTVTFIAETEEGDIPVAIVEPLQPSMQILLFDEALTFFPG